MASTESSAIMNLIKYPKYFHKIEEELRDFGLLDEENDKTTQDVKDHPITDNGVRSSEHTKSDINCNVKSNDTIGVNPDNVTLEKLAKMSYLEQVMKETLRINPPILGGYRQAIKTFQLGVSTSFDMTLPFVCYICSLSNICIVIKRINTKGVGTNFVSMESS